MSNWLSYLYPVLLQLTGIHPHLCCFGSNPAAPSNGLLESNIVIGMKHFHTQILSLVNQFWHFINALGMLLIKYTQCFKSIHMHLQSNQPSQHRPNNKLIQTIQRIT